MKRLLYSIVFAAIGFLALPAMAQKAGNYVLLSSVSVSAAATNTYTPNTTNQIIIPCAEFDNVGLTWTVASTTNSGTTIRLAKSFDGGANFEPTPSIAYTIGASGSGTKFLGTNISTVGVSVLAIAAIENGTAGGATTNTVSIYLKSPKYGARAATQ